MKAMKRREFLKRGVVLGTAVTGAGTVACSEQQGAERIPTGAPTTAGLGQDLALVNARIITLDDPQPEAEAASHSSAAPTRSGLKRVACPCSTPAVAS